MRHVGTGVLDPTPRATATWWEIHGTSVLQFLSGKNYIHLPLQMSVAGLRAGVLGKPSATRAVLEGTCSVEELETSLAALWLLQNPQTTVISPVLSQKKNMPKAELWTSWYLLWGPILSLGGSRQLFSCPHPDFFPLSPTSNGDHSSLAWVPVASWDSVLHTQGHCHPWNQKECPLHWWHWHHLHEEIVKCVLSWWCG